MNGHGRSAEELLHEGEEDLTPPAKQMLAPSPLNVQQLHPPRPPRPPAPPGLPRGARPPVVPASPLHTQGLSHTPGHTHSHSSPVISPTRSTWNGFPSPTSNYFETPFQPRPGTSTAPQSPHRTSAPPLPLSQPPQPGRRSRPLPTPPPLSPATAQRQQPIYSPSAWSPHGRSASSSSVYLTSTSRSSSHLNLSQQYSPAYGPGQPGPDDWASDPSSWSFRSSVASFDFPSSDGSHREPQRESVVVDELLQHREFEEDGIQRFQSGALPSSEADWHRLVPPAALEALPKQEIQRQSIIFELIKSEREYVSDLRAVEDVFVSRLRSSSPPAVAPKPVLDSFLLEVFSNLAAVRAHHERMLTRLFERQREQHPILISIADIVLDSTLQSTPDYEIYIKHYPLAEARHRRELKHNPAYSALLQSCAEDPRIRKRDLVTFLSRPVTRLPRLSLLLENMARQTPADHPDTETQSTDLILNLLRDFVRSTQPGIAAADAKVKYWSLCESLVFRRGEILDMDLYDEKRTLVKAGKLGRRRRTEMGMGGWSELYVGLLDNYLLLTQQESHMGNVKHVVVSRPIPLQYLRLGSFNAPPDTRRQDRTHSPSGTLSPTSGSSSGFNLPLPLLLQKQHPVYPFTIYHAADRAQRRYTLYADSEKEREQWREALVDAVGVMKVWQESNRWFALNPLSSYFRAEARSDPKGKTKLPGSLVCAASFSYGQRDFIAVGCSDGVWVGYRGDGKSYRKVLTLTNVTAMCTLPRFDQLVIQHDHRLVSYSLPSLARVAAGDAPSSQAYGSFERISKPDEAVAFFRLGEVSGRMLVVYGVRRPLRTTAIIAVEAVADPSKVRAENKQGRSPLFVPYGETFYVPKDANDIVLLQKKIAVCTEKGFMIHDPADTSNSVPILVPDFTNAATDKAMASLKARCEAFRPLGMVRSGEAELLVVYEEFGVYITKHGIPARRSGYVRWEFKATGVVFRAPHVLLFDNDFMEIREAATGRLEQVIEGRNLRLVGDLLSNGPLLVATKGEPVDGETPDILAELVQTQPLTADQLGVWDEWGLW